MPRTHLSPAETNQLYSRMLNKTRNKFILTGTVLLTIDAVIVGAWYYDLLGEEGLRIGIITIAVGMNSFYGASIAYETIRRMGNPLINVLNNEER